MEYSIAPDGIMCGAIDTVDQEQINQIIAGNYHPDKEASTLFSRMAISLQESIKKCVPEEWNIDFVTCDIVFQQNHFFYESMEDKQKIITKKTLERIQFYADRWFSQLIRESSQDEIFLIMYTIESDIQEEIIQQKYFKRNEHGLFLLDFIGDILLMYKKKLKVIKLEELVHETRKEPKCLFDIWMRNEEYTERVKKWDEVMNYLAEREFLSINGQDLCWEYAEGKKRNPFLAALLLKLKQKKYINIEDRKGKMYMNILKKTFNVKLSTPADFNSNSVKLWNNSSEIELYKNMP